jgi:hypothetical protein
LATQVIKADSAEMEDNFLEKDLPYNFVQFLVQNLSVA